MRILWITNIPSPYRVDFFNELGKQCDLTVVCETRGEADRDTSWLNFDAANFALSFISEGADLKSFLSGGYDINILTNYYTGVGMKAIAYLKRKRIPYVIEGDGAFAGSGRGIKEALKKWLIKDAKYVFSTSGEHDLFYKTYGISDEKIIRYPFTSIKESDILASPTTKEDKEAIRAELGMKEEKIILSVGQFIPRKGYDVLLKSLVNLKSRNVGCYIVGGNPTLEYTDLVKSLGLEEKVHFVGFKLKNELEKYYLAADLFILPTREDIWGLVINEAMAKGLPIVTTTRCIAGLELVKNPDAGCLVEPEDEKQLAAAIDDNLVLTEERSEKILEIISDYSIEKMAYEHMKAFTEIICK